MTTTPPPTASWDEPLGANVPATDPTDTLSIVRALHRTKGAPGAVPALLEDIRLTADEWLALVDGAVQVQLTRRQLEAVEIAYGCVMPYLTDASLAERDLLAARLDYAYAQRVTGGAVHCGRTASGDPAPLDADRIRHYAQLLFYSAERGDQPLISVTPPRRRRLWWPWICA